ncbi:MAG: hypothetical protein QOI21_2234 [Actinomycetota bacterium]|nr:hypothetical protein [Actinomycetota bacterium]
MVETLSPAVRTRKVLSGNQLGIDAILYAAFLSFAIATAVASEFYGYRVWGNFAIAGYGLATAHSCWLLARTRAGHPPGGRLGSRWVSIVCIGLVAMVAPLLTLVVRRLTGIDWLNTPGSWAAQPEVWVIERSATLLLDHGTPYVDVTALGRAAEVNDYTPYGPVMAFFGLPRALFGGSPLADALTDARLMFALVACLCVVVTLWLLRWPQVPVRAAQLAIACPLTALTWAVAGPDLAIVGLMMLAFALAARDKPGPAALALAIVLSAKLIVAPAAVVLAVVVLARQGKRALAMFLGTFLVTSIVIHVPVLLVDPRSFVEHMFRFPLGLGVVKSPAASPLPGYLIASMGPIGMTIAFVLLAAAAVAMVGWLVRRPPATGSDALLRTAAGLSALTLLAPATRYGYLVYPLVLLGAMMVFRRSEEDSKRATPPAPATTSS